MTLAPGSKLGPYEILDAIGAGGMGEVYRAKDPRLAREVAIKVLPASFSQDADRLRRFEQEAKAAGVLNHPNITAVYDIGQHDGAPYVVQELLEGETLRSTLAGGKLSPRKVADYALQIAHGLAAAHAKGIVHRDLKPENLFVTSDNRLKILDFGLAKLTQPEGAASAATDLPTETRGTEPGVVLGTLGYMSPEQVRGKPADARSDIFSFGAILYEMLSGKRAFHGDSAADTMSAILKEDPPELSVTNQSVSPALDRIVRHSLEKNPDLRFQSARDLAFNLEALSATSAPSGMGVATAPRPRVPWLLIGALAAVAAAFLAGRFSKPEQSASQPTWERLTFRRGNLGAARFAPDGKSAIYGASWEGKPIEIYSSRPGSPESTTLGYRNANLLGVSPAGELALSLRDSFLTGVAGVGTLARAPLGGGVPRPILEFVEWADWTPDGKDLAIVRFADGLNRVEFPIGKVLYESPRGLFTLRFSPRGDRLAFIERPGLLRVMELTGKPRTLAEGIRGITLAWSPSGDEIFVDTRSGSGEGRILGIDLSGKSRVVLRCPDRLFLYDIAADGRFLVERAASRRRAVALAPGESTEREISWFDGSEPNGLSADGRAVLMSEYGDAGRGTDSFYLRKTDGSPAVKLGEGDAQDLSADGKWVLVRSDDGRSLSLVPTGTGSRVSLPAAGWERIGRAVFLDDPRQILIFADDHVDQKIGHYYLQEVPSGNPRKVGSGYSFLGQPVSPDGKRMVSLGKDWNAELVVTPLDGGQARTIPHTKTLDPIRWSADGGSLFAYELGSMPARIFKVDVATGRREPWKEIGPADISGAVQIDPIVMTPDARAYVYSYSFASTSDLFVVDGLDIRGRKAKP